DCSHAAFSPYPTIPSPQNDGSAYEMEEPLRRHRSVQNSGIPDAVSHSASSPTSTIPFPQSGAEVPSFKHDDGLQPGATPFGVSQAASSPGSTIPFPQNAIHASPGRETPEHGGSEPS